jgi:hypothetical protein
MEKALFSAGYELTRMHHAAHGWQMQQTRYQPKSDQRSPPLYDPLLSEQAMNDMMMRYKMAPLANG